MAGETVGTSAGAGGRDAGAPPTEILAADKKYHCPACGAEAQWNPKKQTLICPFCGTESPVTIDKIGAIVEHDLVAALRGIPDSSRGWQADKVSVKCQSCQAISVVDPSRQAQNCPFCGSAQLIPYEQIKDAFRPESLLPFKVSEPQARDTIRSWYGRVWFAPNALRKQALTDTVQGVYLPYWTFDANVAANWRAEAGHYYYTTETYQDGNGRTQTRQVQHVRWEPAAGNLKHFFDDALVCASVGVKPSLLRSIEPFPTTNQLVPYSSAYVTGWTVERYQIDLVAAAQNSRNQMENELRQLCVREIPGDTYRNLQIESRWTNQTFKHVLVPVWLLSYHYGARAFQVVMNGYTGRISGEYPKSWIKIGLAVIAALIVVLVFLSLGGRHR